MFKENMNVNFSVYLEDLRLTEAAHLIEKGESGINEIALEVGYNNQTSFRRAFKKNMALHRAALAFSLNKKWRILQ